MPIKNNKILLKKITALVIIGITFFTPITQLKAVGYADRFYNSSKDAFSDNPYAFNIQNAGETFSSVVGCTGITNKVAESIEKVIVKGEKFGAEVNSKFKDVFSSENKKETLKEGKTADGVIEKIEENLNKTSTEDTKAYNDFIENIGSYQFVPTNDRNVETLAKNIREENKDINSNTSATQSELEQSKVREQCLNGVAYALAKKQLSKIVNDTLYWANTGLGGDPLFVRDQVSYLQDIADEQLINFLNPISSTQNASIYPYGRNFARGILGYRSTTFEDRSQSTLNMYLPPNTSIDEWENDFSIGGWSAWLAFTQNPANNPLGYQIIATEELAKRQAEALEAAKSEIDQGNGFISQKECVEWIEDGVYNIKGENGDTITIDPGEIEDTGEFEREIADDYFSSINTYNGYKCLRYETITPGSVIQNQVNNALNTSVRQLELADSLNESLGILFQNMVNNLMNKGLSGLKNMANQDFSSINTPFLSGYYDSLGNDLSLLPGYNKNRSLIQVNQGSGINTSDFDITVDLGDVMGDVYYEGCIGLDGKMISCKARDNPLDPYLVNKIILDECSDGVDNDKDGLSDSNDPSCQTKNRRVVKKGLIRIQKEYIQMVNIAKRELPKILPALGELDYCIPGPNPGWENPVREQINENIELLRSLSLDDDGRIVSIYGSLEETIKTFEESQKVTQSENIVRGIPVFGQIAGIIIDSKRLQAQKTYEEQLRAYQDELKKEVARFEKDRSNAITKMIDTFLQYKNDVDRLYGPNSVMRTPPTLFSKNDYYLSMANTGIELTKDLRTYAENIDQALIDYDDSISKTNANIYKLEEIKKKVDVIINRAKNRRTDDIIRGRIKVDPSCYGLLDLNIDSETTIGGQNRNSNPSTLGAQSGGTTRGGPGSATGTTGSGSTGGGVVTNPNGGTTIDNKNKVGDR